MNKRHNRITISFGLFLILFLLYGGVAFAQSSSFLTDLVKAPLEETSNRFQYGSKIYVQSNILKQAEVKEKEVVTKETVKKLKTLVEEVAAEGKLDDFIAQLEAQEKELPKDTAEASVEEQKKAAVLRMCLSMAYGIKGDKKKKEIAEKKVKQSVEKRSLTVGLFADYGIATYSDEEKDLAWKLENLSLEDVVEYGDAIFEFIHSREEAKKWIEIGITRKEWEFARLVLDGSLDRTFIQKAYYTEKNNNIDSYLLAQQLAQSMVLIESGSFEMGSTGGSDFERPVHQVELTSDYYISPHQVTFALYDTYCDITGAEKPDDQGWGRDRRPVINISWMEAVQFSNWLSRALRLSPVYSIQGTQVSTSPRANGFRLPTEAEWEYAALLGNGESKEGQLENIDNQAWYSENSGDMTHPVAKKQPNQIGLYDMQGNVWEMCWDYFSEDYYDESASRNPKGPENGELRVVRGGSWSNRRHHCTLSYRFFTDPRQGDKRLGFRLVRNSR